MDLNHLTGTIGAIQEPLKERDFRPSPSPALCFPSGLDLPELQQTVSGWVLSFSFHSPIPLPELSSKAVEEALGAVQVASLPRPQ